jgi:hypothetical protein
VLFTELEVHYFLLQVYPPSNGWFLLRFILTAALFFKIECMYYRLPNETWQIQAPWLDCHERPWLQRRIGPITEYSPKDSLSAMTANALLNLIGLLRTLMI